jgi:hypothetical protein
MSSLLYSLTHKALRLKNELLFHPCVNIRLSMALPMIGICIWVVVPAGGAGLIIQEATSVFQKDASPEDLVFGREHIEKLAANQSIYCSQIQFRNSIGACW